MVSVISGSAFLSEPTLYLRDILRSNITDPLSRTGSGNQFIFTSYPKSNVKYPIITLKQEGSPDFNRLGLQSEQVAMNLPFEARVWARNEKEKDTLSQNIFNVFRRNQFGTGSESNNVCMNDFTMNSMVNVDEPGEEGIKSKVMSYKWLLIITD